MIIPQEMIPFVKPTLVLLCFLIFVLYVRRYNTEKSVLRNKIPESAKIILRYNKLKPIDSEKFAKIKYYLKQIKHLGLRDLRELDSLITQTLKEITESENKVVTLTPSNNHLNKLVLLDVKLSTFRQIHGADILSFIVNPEDRDIWREFSIDNFSMIDEYHRIIDAATARASTLESLNSRHFGDHSRTVATKGKTALWGLF